MFLRTLLSISAFVFASTFFCSVSFSTFAQELLDDRRDVPRGLYAGLSTGSFLFLDSEDRALYGDGWLIGLKFGYDIFKYLSVESHYRASGHDTAFSGTGNQSIPEAFFSHQFLLMTRGNYPLSKRWTVSGDLGGGIWYTAPNIKPNVTESARFIINLGLGVQYFTKIRGIVIGLDPALSILGDMKGPAIQTTGYVRYTF